ncbi:MAG: peptidase C15 [Cyanophyceae cyanobacterium]
MSPKILLTSFQTWLPHQPSNASDDLLVMVQERLPQTTFVRQLPVDTARASERVLAAIADVQPEMVICCGMAESRYQLTVESQATWTSDRLYTSVDLEALVDRLVNTAISHDAGKFVCEGLYYQVLKHLPSHSQCVFVHVPLLTATNVPTILTDFITITKVPPGRERGKGEKVPPGRERGKGEKVPPGRERGKGEGERGNQLLTMNKKRMLLSFLI